MFRGVLGSWLADSRWLLMSGNKFRVAIPLPGHFTLPSVQILTINTKGPELVIEGLIKQSDGREGGGWFGPQEKF